MLSDKRFLFCIFAVLYFSISGCGPSLDGELAEEGENKASTQENTASEQQPVKSPEVVTVPIKIYYDQGDGLGLVDVTAAVSYSVTLTGCASGYTETSSTTLSPYNFDVGCYAKLTQFVYDGTDNFTYTQTAAGASAFNPDNRTGYLAGEQAVFATDDVGAPTHKTKLRVYVEQQLSNAITAGDAVIYRFSHIEKGSDKTILKSTIDRDGTTVTVTSVAPPSFTLDTANLVNITATGAGEWEFILQCSANISGAGDDRVCAQVDMFDNLRVKLVEDSWSSSPTVTDLESAFGTAANSGNAIATGDIHDAGTTTVKGGFKTPNTGEANVLTGPDQMHLNPNMILILRSEDSGQYSWQYFNVDVDVNN